MLVNQGLEENREILRQFYDDVYKAGLYNPNNSENQWELLLQDLPPFKRGLDVGCGPGYGVKYCKGKDCIVYGMDLAHIQRIWDRVGIKERCVVGEAQAIPFKNDSFDLVFCADVLEHIMDRDIDFVFSEMARVGYGYFFFSISLEEERKPVADKIYTHITIKSPEWWLNKITTNNIKILHKAIFKEHLIVYGGKVS